MKFLRILSVLVSITIIASCSSSIKNNVPVVGFVDAFEDATISQAKDGFIEALKKNGFSEDQKTVKIEYRNAQGSIPTLTQIVNYFVSEKVDLLATSTTLATVAAIQKTKNIPIFQMVSPTPERMKVADATGKGPANLYGTMEELNYIDTSFAIIPKLLKPKGAQLTIGMIYNQSEPQSADALQRIQELAAKLNIKVIALPLNSSTDAQLVTQALLNKGIDAFFANPDNTVFSAFETIRKSCDQKNVPVFTSEAGLVQRGAVAAFGADIYQWGYQSGLQAAQYLKTHKTDGLKLEMVKIRKRVYNPAVAKKYNIRIPADFETVK
ncbi:MULTISPECIES: ABC transporter substrate-binding protein [unclassified Mucilaginibacter]|uniref:ABC transporter substrate-binding protein n=1 Tax=unclassified Mucilaginibacter TaxID=2617802 RepID=UPI002AC8DE50|nr:MULTISPECIES: ABC transporter substrate-binding protein [unclassified Mucilaginibacter]MEB0261873.1 ABC transporter substrate-binding protein [Mucilaginibacter sp. 10I4]MEB0278905.1 ABC transporter substrate-binding protein [Mucilaginibacter sp. 10B2]MEB0299729.1 ABC transporter substrate-binding protein [Mucilaginibacter sp. 5C4]WPX22087.1 ABC transporter substrate-binding protein [Mucilaginibacter sp. 5C4]